MLRRLFVLNRLSVEEAGARLCDTRLLDLDRDGQEELFVAFQGEYRSEAEVPCQFALYRWDGKELEEYPGTAGMDELHLARYENEYGILGAGRDPDLPLTQSLTDQDTSDPSAGQEESLEEQTTEQSEQAEQTEQTEQTEEQGETVPEEVRDQAEAAHDNSHQTSGSPGGDAQTDDSLAEAGESAPIVRENGTGGGAETEAAGGMDTDPGTVRFSARNTAQSAEQNTARNTDQADTQTASQSTDQNSGSLSRTAARDASAEAYTLRYSYTFLSHSEELVMDAEGDRRAYHVVRSGRQGDIAESEFQSIRERYTVLQTLVNYRTGGLENQNYTAIISALFRMQAEA